MAPRSYWIPGSYTPALSEKHNSFLRLLKNKGFREERMTKFGLYAIGKTTTLESNKSLVNKLNDGGLGIMVRHLPSYVLRAQPEEHFASGFNVDGQASRMLHSGMDIPKVPLQSVLAVDGVGAGGMKQAVNHSHRFMHAVGNGQPGLGDLAARIGHTSAHGLPRRLNSREYIGACSTEDGFSLGYLRLHQGAIP